MFVFLEGLVNGGLGTFNQIELKDPLEAQFADPVFHTIFC